MIKKLQKNLVSILKVVVPIGIGGFLLWHFYDSMDEKTKEIFYTAINEADYLWILLSMVLGLLSHFSRAYRWKYMLEPIGYQTKFWHRYHALMVGYLVNLLIPRAGEATRAALLYQTDKIPFSKSFGTIITERIFDTLVLGIIVLVAIGLSLDDLIAIKDIIVSGSPGKEGQGLSWFLIVIFSVLAVGVLVFAFLWFKVDKFKNKVKGFIKELIHGVLAIFKTKQPFQFILHTFFIWGLYLIFFGICFLAFDSTQHFPISGMLLGFIAGTFGMVFTNGGVGAYPYLVGIVVIFYIGDSFDSTATAEGVGKALGMIIWLSQTVMMIILGLLSMIFLPRNYKKEKR